MCPGSHAGQAELTLSGLLSGSSPRVWRQSPTEPNAELARLPFQQLPWDLLVAAAHCVGTAGVCCASLPNF